MLTKYTVHADTRAEKGKERQACTGWADGVASEDRLGARTNAEDREAGEERRAMDELGSGAQRLSE
jgi:hypothetical protein